MWGSKQKRPRGAGGSDGIVLTQRQLQHSSPALSRPQSWLQGCDLAWGGPALLWCLRTSCTAPGACTRGSASPTWHQEPTVTLTGAIGTSSAMMEEWPTANTLGWAMSDSHCRELHGTLPNPHPSKTQEEKVVTVCFGLPHFPLPQLA